MGLMSRLDRVEAALDPGDDAPEFRIVLPLNRRDETEASMPPDTMLVISAAGAEYVSPGSPEYAELMSDTRD